MADGMLRSPTFLVGAERQRKNLDEFKRREQQLAEAYHKNKPLCFNACSYQKTHPVKAQKGHKDADACLTVPLILGVADGVSQIEDFGIDASMLPNELLHVVEQLGMHQLIPGAKLSAADTYRGPVSMLRRAFEATESLGSLTVVLAVMDNSTRIHGKLHPMIAIITVGDCELLVLRRVNGARAPLELVCHTEMQRIDGHAQTPLQLARVDERIDANFHEGLTIEVIERGSAVHCVSAYEGDIVIMGSDGVFDNLFLDELLELANRTLLPTTTTGPQYSETQLRGLAQRIVEQCHTKTRPMANGMLPEAPIGGGGKKDDTSCVVAEVVVWTEELQKMWALPAKEHWPFGFGFSLFDGGLLNLNGCCAAAHDSDDDVEHDEPVKPSFHPNEGTATSAQRPNGSNQEKWNDFGPHFTSGAQPMIPAQLGQPGTSQPSQSQGSLVGHPGQMFGMQGVQGMQGMQGMQGQGLQGQGLQGQGYPMSMLPEAPLQGQGHPAMPAMPIRQEASHMAQVPGSMGKVPMSQNSLYPNYPMSVQGNQYMNQMYAGPPQSFGAFSSFPSGPGQCSNAYYY